MVTALSPSYFAQFCEAILLRIKWKVVSVLSGARFVRVEGHCCSRFSVHPRSRVDRNARTACYRLQNSREFFPMSCSEKVVSGGYTLDLK